jgi:DNA-directed RNA polymerase subunit omega
MSNMTEPPIEELLAVVGGSKFQLVTFAARRGRNINSYFNQLGEGLGHMIPPQVSSGARKPLTIALEEIAARKIRVANVVEDPLFDLALRALRGSPIELYIQGEELSDFEDLADSLDQLARVGGRSLSVEELVRGSFWARLGPYGEDVDSPADLSPNVQAEIERARRVRPMPDIESPTAVKFQDRLMVLADVFKRCPPPCAFLVEGLLLAKQWADDGVLTLSRELSDVEWHDYCGGRLSIDLADVDAVISLIRSGPPILAMG